MHARRARAGRPRHLQAPHRGRGPAHGGWVCNNGVVVVQAWWVWHGVVGVAWRGGWAWRGKLRASRARSLAIDARARAAAWEGAGGVDPGSAEDPVQEAQRHGSHAGTRAPPCRVRAASSLVVAMGGPPAHPPPPPPPPRPAVHRQPPQRVLHFQDCKGAGVGRRRDRQCRCARAPTAACCWRRHLLWELRRLLARNQATPLSPTHPPTHAVWSGVRLRDVLQHAGLEDEDAEVQHIQVGGWVDGLEGGRAGGCACHASPAVASRPPAHPHAQASTPPAPCAVPPPKWL